MMDLKGTTRLLRKRSTDTEKIFWMTVRNRKVNGKKFLRQYPVKFQIGSQWRAFIADFYCHEKKLIVEIDSGVHESQRDYDKLRDHLVGTLGFNVIRFNNSDVEKRLETVIASLERTMKTIVTQDTV